MLLDWTGRPLQHALVDPIYDPRVQDGGHALPMDRFPTAEFRRDLAAELDRARVDSAGAALGLDGVNLDGFVNELTGLGTTWGDKTLGGQAGGPTFDLYRMRGFEAELRARGSDLGRNIVDKIPDEMTRAGWSVEVQPSDDEEETADPALHADACRRHPARAAAGWRKHAEQLDRDDRARALHLARRWDQVAAGTVPTAAAPPPPPGALPPLNDRGIALAEAMKRLEKDLGVGAAINQALRYERQHGGGAVLLGVDDGVEDLTVPLDLARVRRVTHLTAMTGGWDGEVVMWRPYNDPRKAKYGRPEIYQVRNTSVQLARPPAPGETRPVSQLIPQGPTGPTIFYVHESRFLIFDGQPVSRASQQEMQGWGDSVFTRVNQVLSDYSQTWNAVAVLLSEFSIATLSIKGLARALAEKGAAARQAFLEYARFQAVLQSVARMRFIDADEQFQRVTASVAGVAEMLREWSLRLAAAADMPVSLLFGQVKGGLGDAGSTDIRFFYDRIAAQQQNRLLPQLERFYRIAWKSKDGPSRGVEPEHWSVVFKPLWQPTALEKADLRLKTAQGDATEIAAQVVTPEEVAATRYGGAEYNSGPVVLDVEGRRAQARRTRAPPPPPRLPAPPEPAATPPNGHGGVVMPQAMRQPLHQPVPPMTAMPSDPLTGDPQSTPSNIGQTGAGGRPLLARPPVDK